MTVEELIEKLQHLENPDAEVRLAWQPNYPLFATVGDVVAGNASAHTVHEDETPDFVYITQEPDGDSGYASSTLFGGPEDWPEEYDPSAR